MKNYKLLHLNIKKLVDFVVIKAILSDNLHTCDRIRNKI